MNKFKLLPVLSLGLFSLGTLSGAGISSSLTDLSATTISGADYTLTQTTSTDGLIVTKYLTNDDGSFTAVNYELTATIGTGASNTTNYYNYSAKGKDAFVLAASITVDDTTSTLATYTTYSSDGTVDTTYQYDSDTSTYYSYDSTTETYSAITDETEIATASAAVSAITSNIESASYDIIANDTTARNTSYTNDAIGLGSTSMSGSVRNSITGGGTLTGTFISNTSGSSTASGGGTISISSAITATVNSDFIANYSSKQGAALRLSSSCNLTITGDFISNYAGTMGGAILATSSTIKVTGDFIGNYAGTQGGALWLSGTPATITSDFIGNYAGTQGGAVWITAGTGSFRGNFIANSAGDLGGAFYLAATGIANLYADALYGNMQFTGNTANGASNAIYNLGTVNFHADNGYSITVNDAISGLSTARGTMSITGVGTTIFNNTVAYQNITVNKNATLSLGSYAGSETLNVSASNASFVGSSLTLSDGATLIIESALSLNFDSDSSLAISVGDAESFIITFNVGLGSSISLGDISEADIYSFLNDVDNLAYLLGTDSEYVTIASADDEISTESYVLTLEGTVDNGYYTINLTTAVPEPSTYAMIIGVLALGFAYYRRRK